MKTIEIYYTNGNILTFDAYDAQIDGDRLYLASLAPVGIAQIVSISLKQMTHIYIDGTLIYRCWKEDIQCTMG